MRRAAACLDPFGGRIVGYALGAPGRVRLTLDGASARRVLAAAPLEVLPEEAIEAIGPPPTAICAFEARLPRAAAGSHLEIWASERRGGEELLVFEHRFASDRALARDREGVEMLEIVSIEDVRLQGGVFTAKVVVSGDGPLPEIALRVLGREVGEARLAPTGGEAYRLTATLEADALGDGVSTVDFALADGSVAARYPIAAGAVLAGDLAAEVASLRAEVAQMKAAMREALAGGTLRRDERPMIVAEALAQVDNVLEMRDRAERAHQRAEATEWDEDQGVWEIED